MKPAWIIRLLPIAIILLLTSFTSVAQKQYHVIVGAFAVKSNAVKFTGYVRSRYYNAQYELHKKSNLFYVYVLKSTEREAAAAQAKQLQQESEFKDAWVFLGELESLTPAPPVVKNEPDVTPTPPVDVDTVTVAAPMDTTVAEARLEVADTSAVESIPTPKGKLFKFVILNSDGQPFNGNVHSVDFARGRDLATYQSNKYVDVLPPAAPNTTLTVVCGVFGYKEVVKNIDYANPETVEGAVKDENNAWIIPYRLERMNSGDVSVMYRVSFYKDAVVMLPESQKELDELVNMMQGNPNYKIKIHGHCNGTNSRRIIALGESKNYFDVKGSNEIEGSAKELSKLRALAVQTYLADHGIDPSRSQVQAWGGTNMLVAETSNSAKLNDRIEIEILKH